MDEAFRLSRATFDRVLRRAGRKLQPIVRERAVGDGP
jgi:hypothetical protein